MGRLINFYVGTSASFSVDTTEHKITVPAGRRWKILYGYCKPDVNATLDVDCYNSSDEKISYLLDQAASTNAYSIYPADTNIDKQTAGGFAIDLQAGDYIRFKFGAAQGVAVVLSLVVEEFAI